MQPMTSQVLAGVKNIIAVASGKGGVGKSTTAANLALALAREGAQVGLLDADIYGPSQGIMFGLTGEQRPEVRDGKFFVPLKAHGVSLMSMAFLTDDNTPVVWRGPMVSGALLQLLGQTAWGALDYLIVDIGFGLARCQKRRGDVPQGQYSGAGRGGKYGNAPMFALRSY